MMKQLSSLFVFGLLVLTTVACSRSGNEGGLAKSKSAATEFIFNNGAEPETLDPHKLSSHDAALLDIQMFEGLLSREANYTTLKPGIAESWSISPDGKTYKFVLRSNLKWSDGSPLTVKDVRGSFIRAINPALTNPYAYWHTDYIVGAADLEKHYDSVNRKKYEDAYGVKITGENSIEIQLIKPVAFFKFFLSQPPFFVVHPSMYDPDSKAWTDASKFIGNGAYKLKEWSVNEKIVMVKNEHYRDADQVKLETLVSLPINDQSTTMNMYKTGEIDWTGDNLIASNLVPGLKSREDFYRVPSLGTYMYLFNTEKAPFKDARVRKALGLAINREDITDRVLRSGVLPTSRIVPPIIKGYNSLIPDEKPLSERIAEAKALLKEAGFDEKNPFPSFTIRYNTQEGHHKVAQAIQQAWNVNLGLDVKLENMEWKVFLKEQQAGNYEVSRQGWIGDYPDPATFLEIFLSTSENNHSKFKNADYDRLIEQAMSTIDDAKRFEIYAKAEKILADESPAFGIYNYVWFGLMRPEIKGFEPNMFGHYLFQYFSKEAPAGSTAAKM